MAERDLRVRPARPEDAEAALVVHVGAILANGPQAYDDRQVAAWAAKTEGAERYAAAAADPETTMLVAEPDRADASGPEVVGFGQSEPGGEVTAVFVDPAHEGAGVGSRLLGRLEAGLREAGCETVELRPVRNAVGFYERHGYEPVEWVTTETTAGVELDSLRMRKPL